MNDETNISQIRDRIWLTTKSRIYAERRYRRYDIVSHIVLALLSVIVIAITLLRDELPQAAPLDAYTVVYSVFILAASIVVFGFKFGEIATLHRECYLRLQQLHDSTDEDDALVGSYHDILSSYPNHSDCDYESLVISRTFPKSGSMSRPDGTAISWTAVMLIRWLAYQIVFWTLTIALLVASVGTIFWLW